MDVYVVLRVLCGAFYGVLCVFSVVTGLIYMSGRRALNPLELSDAFVAKLTTEEKKRTFAKRMGLVTFVVGIVQGLTAFSLFRADSPALYWIALGFTLFSIASVAFKLKGKVSAFPLVKLAAYLAILAVLLLGGTRAAFFGEEGTYAGQEAEAAVAPTYEQIDQETAREMMVRADGHVVVDVRRQDEYDAGHIPGAILVPNETIGEEMPEALPDLEQVILVYCRSGNRSKQAAEKLADIGYSNVYEFGGIIDWTGEIEY